VRLLLVAPCCDGEDVGEAWVAFQWVRRLAERHDVTLVTYHKRDRTPAALQLEGVRVVEWPEPPLVGRAERLNSLLKPAYVPFYWRARRWIKVAQARGERFDLAHQIVPVAMRYPCPASGLGVPVVIGPVGGSLDTPRGFEGDNDTAPWYMGLRSLDRARIRWDPWLRQTYDGACCVIGIAPYVADFLSPRPISRFEVMSETGIESLPEIGPHGGTTGPVRLLYVGRIVRTKGLRDAIRALSLLRTDVPVVLDVVGDGFDRAACEALVLDLGLAGQVTFHGFLPREHVDAFYSAADVFLFPSYREPGGNVVFEAMGFALPVVVSDRGGPGNVVDDTCGLRVHPANPTQFADDLAVALTTLIENPTLRSQLGLGSRRRVAEIALWDNKVEQLEAIYADVLAQSGTTATLSAKPDR
jgi:glycosyltransferase involved in cell wall biosynthesis